MLAHRSACGGRCATLLQWTAGASTGAATSTVRRALHSITQPTQQQQQTSTPIHTHTHTHITLTPLDNVRTHVTTRVEDEVGQFGLNGGPTNNGAAADQPHPTPDITTFAPPISSSSPSLSTATSVPAPSPSPAPRLRHHRRVRGGSRPTLLDRLWSEVLNDATPINKKRKNNKNGIGHFDLSNDFDSMFGGVDEDVTMFDLTTPPRLTRMGNPFRPQPRHPGRRRDLSSFPRATHKQGAVKTAAIEQLYQQIQKEQPNDAGSLSSSSVAGPDSSLVPTQDQQRRDASDAKNDISIMREPVRNISPEEAQDVMEDYAFSTLIPTAHRFGLADPMMLFCEKLPKPSKSNPTPTDANGGGYLPLKLFAEQIHSEKIAVKETAWQYKQLLASMRKGQRIQSMRPSQRLLLQWYEPLVNAIHDFKMEDVSTHRGRVSHNLLLIGSSELAILTMHHLLGLVLHQPEGVKYTMAAITLGKAVEIEIKTEIKKREEREAMLKWKGGKEKRKQEMEAKKKKTLLDHPFAPNPTESPAGVFKPNPSLSNLTSTSSSSSSSSSFGVDSTDPPSTNPLNEFHLNLDGSESLPDLVRHSNRIKHEPWTTETQVLVGSLLVSSFIDIAGLPKDLIKRKASGYASPPLQSEKYINTHTGATVDASMPNASAATATTNPLKPSLPRPSHTDSKQREEDIEFDWEERLNETSEADLGPKAEAIVQEYEGLFVPSQRHGGVGQTTPDNIKKVKVTQQPAVKHAPAAASSRVVDSSASSQSHASSSSSFGVSVGGEYMEPIHTSSPDFVPALFHFYRSAKEIDGDFKAVGMIRADVRLVKIISEDPDTLKSLVPKFNPMLCQPRRWTSPEDGGYLTVKHRLVRTINSPGPYDSLNTANLTRIYDGVNYLASTPWTINTPVWQTIKTLWKMGGAVGDLPPTTDLPLPPPPDRWNKQAVEQYNKIKQHNGNLYSQRCDLQYKFNAAADLEGRTMYYPYFLDFRGRAYPIPPYLNHTGGDVSRGLLRFAVSKELGERGLYQLMVHTATLYGGGVDKESYTKRREWTEKNIANIARTCADPIKDQWWRKADKPFQFLGAAYEVYAALRSPSPAKFRSSLPVHTDGSCNGLQHYAALGRDLWGGTCVNLVKGEKPQDVYARVLDTVLIKLQTDATEGKDQMRSDFAKKLLTIKLTRKVVKQAVMTSVYGVTLVGARDQVQARLVEIPAAVDLFGTDMLRVSMYLASLTLNSLYDAFAGARRIQNWLGDCATMMAEVGQPVSWVTPLGLPVIQPYRAAHQHTVTTQTQKVSLVSHSENLPVSSLRQKSAFPPNFIHSLDASHMLMTARAAEERQLTFAAVHDSYWTHAGSMDELSRALREEFVSLYEQPILQHTRDLWVRRYPEVSFPPVPKVGELNIKEVLDSPYFFN